MTDEYGEDGQELLRAAETVLAAAARAGAASAEVFFGASFARRIGYRDREPESVETSRHTGFSLRVVQHGRLGFSYFSSTEPQVVETAVRGALTSARLGDEEGVTFRGAQSCPAEPPGLLDPDFHRRPQEEKTSLVERWIDEAFSVSPLITRIRTTSYAEKLAWSGLISSCGHRSLKKGTHYSLGIYVMASNGADSEAVYEWVPRRSFNGLQGGREYLEAADRAVQLLGGGPVTTGRYPVVLHSSVAAALLDVLTAALSGEAVAKGKSPLAGKIGEPFFSPLLTLVDDGLLPGGWASEGCDDEGVGKSTLTVVEGGVLRSFLLNLKAARLLDAVPTGHGSRRDYKALPGVAPSNLYITPGTVTPEELESQLDRGLAVMDILGAHTMDPISGMVSLGASGFLIEGGRRTRPFRGVTMAGNLYEMLRQVAGVGSDLRWYGDVGSPSLLIEGLDISGT